MKLILEVEADLLSWDIDSSTPTTARAAFRPASSHAVFMDYSSTWRRISGIPSAPQDSRPASARAEPHLPTCKRHICWQTRRAA